MSKTTMQTLTKPVDFNTHATNSRARLRAHALKLTGNREDADDLLQNTLIKANNAFSSFDHSQKFENWGLRIMDRAFLDSIRSRNRRVKTGSIEDMTAAVEMNHEGVTELYFEEKDEMNVLARIVDNERCDEIMSMIATLPETQREALELSIGGLEYEDIATHQGVGTGTVRSRLHRARITLAKMMTEVN